MTIDKENLKALAESQEFKDWSIFFAGRAMRSNQRMFSLNGPSAVSCHENWGFTLEAAQYIAAASPATVLALIAEIEQLKAENEALRKDAENWKTVQRAMEQLKSDEQGAAIWSACSRILISLASDLNSARSVVTEEGVTKDGAEIGDWRVTVERLAIAKEASHV
ncbi:hypothetical protein [Pseudomonas sp. ESBL1]|uniref:hypothetical protein n=1 Tax=Pseudomonas sp. ESBL1 TaxID=3077324 RepID=UPI002FC94C86